PGTHQQETPQQEAVPALDSAPLLAGWDPDRAEGTVHYGPPATRHSTATQAVQDATGPVLVVTSNPAIWEATNDARAKLGPTLLYVSTQQCDTPSRHSWAPTSGCETQVTAVARAAALLTRVRPNSRRDQAVSDTADI